MIITEKFGDALLLALHAPGHCLTRCRNGFHTPRQVCEVTHVTRRTANAIVNAGLATYNDRIVPSAMTLTTAGVARAQAIAPVQAAA